MLNICIHVRNSLTVLGSAHTRTSAVRFPSASDEYTRTYAGVCVCDVCILLKLDFYDTPDLQLLVADQDQLFRNRDKLVGMQKSSTHSNPDLDSDPDLNPEPKLIPHVVG